MTTIALIGLGVLIGIAIPVVITVGFGIRLLSTLNR